MIKLDAIYAARLDAAESYADLHEAVQGAIELEHSTLPPYLTAMFSLRAGSNEAIRSLLRSIVLEEMLHMSIACNIMNALDGKPAINKVDFIPSYPGPLPMGVAGGLVVSLEKYSKAQMEQTFMRIEEPKDPLVFELAAADEELTIGEFYERLKNKILQTPGGDELPGNPDFQVAQFFPADELFPIRSKDDAARAIEIIVRQGEGTSSSPMDGDGELAHYYRFEELFEGRRLVPDSSAPNGYSFSGEVIPFDDSAVFNLFPNTKAAEIPSGTEEQRNANQLNFVYAKLLNGLHKTFNGYPDFLQHTLGLMFDLKLIAERLCASEYPGKPGVHVGPPFEYVNVND